MRLERLRAAYPCRQAPVLEDWLVVMANARGARAVTVPLASSPPGISPRDVSDEELVVALCQVNCLDRPQILRLAAQMVSRGGLNLHVLEQAAIRERAEPVLAELARQALKIAPDHPGWLAVRNMFPDEPVLREPLLHWTRLAEPIMEKGKPNAAGWRLVA